MTMSEYKPQDGLPTGKLCMEASAGTGKTYTIQGLVTRLIAEEGADVIVPGEVPLSLLLALNGVTRIDDVPVIDTFAVTLKMTEMMVDLRRLTGLAASRHGFMNSTPGPERLDQVMAFYGLDKLRFD